MTSPVFLNLLQIKFPITAIVSILHRVSGVVMFLAVPVLYIFLYMSICSQSSFYDLVNLSKNLWIKIIYWLIAVAVIYHAFAGVRHMYYDFSNNHALAGAKKTAFAVILLTILLALAFAFRIFLQS